MNAKYGLKLAEKDLQEDRHRRSSTEYLVAKAEAAVEGGRSVRRRSAS